MEIYFFFLLKVFIYIYIRKIGIDVWIYLLYTWSRYRFHDPRHKRVKRRARDIKESYGAHRMNGGWETTSGEKRGEGKKKERWQRGREKDGEREGNKASFLWGKG